MQSRIIVNLPIGYIGRLFIRISITIEGKVNYVLYVRKNNPPGNPLTNFLQKIARTSEDQTPQTLPDFCAGFKFEKWCQSPRNPEPSLRHPNASGGSHCRGRGSSLFSLF